MDHTTTPRGSKKTRWIVFNVIELRHLSYSHVVFNGRTFPLSQTELHPKAYLSVLLRFIRVFDFNVFCHAYDTSTPGLNVFCRACVRTAMAGWLHGVCLGAC